MFHYILCLIAYTWNSVEIFLMVLTLQRFLFGVMKTMMMVVVVVMVTCKDEDDDDDYDDDDDDANVDLW